MLTTLVNTPIFSVMISLMAFEIGCYIYKKTKLAIFNPLFISIVLVILLLKLLNINLNTYNKGGDLISFFLTPATVILAVPLYKKFQLLKANVFPIIAGITTGSFVGMCFIALLCHLFGLSKDLYVTMLPKSVTVPIGMEISRQLGGIPPITVAAIVMTGIIGAVIGPLICKLFKIKNPVAIGIAIGTASHAVGTTKAIEMGETEGAMSSLAIGVAGLLTVFIAPIIIKMLSSFM